VLLPELFSEHRRCGFYQALARERPDRVACIVYDFIALLSPDVVQLPRSSPFMRYVGIVERAGRRSYISAAVRDDFNRRISHGRRNDRGPVIRLGSDGLGRHAQSAPRGRDLVCLGAFDGRKAQDVVYDAFRTASLPSDVRLVFMGSAPTGPLPGAFEPLLENSRPDVLVLHEATDAEVGRRVAAAAGSVFISTHEGFGLPAVESLYVGVPVIAHERLPSLSGLPPAGQIRLSEVTVESVRTAMEALYRPGAAERLHAEAGQLRLPTWRDYAHEVAAWASA
jgi:glycosyltransferase involved in cell wall biosynthesis